MKKSTKSVIRGFGKNSSSPYFNKEWNKEEVNRIALLIEETFGAFGISVRVKEVYVGDKNIMFRLEVAMGTRVDDVLCLDKEVALAVASPSGKVDIHQMVGRGLIEIDIPLGRLKLKKENYKIIKVKEKVPEISDWERIKIVLGIILKGIGNIFYWLESKLNKQNG